MTIGFDGSRAFVSDRTGTENYSYQLLKALAKLDEKNQYIIFVRPEAMVGQGWPKNFQFSILNLHLLWTQIGLAIQTFKDNLDVLFVPAHTLPVIRKPGLKIVLTVHDLGSEYLASMHQIKQRLYLGLMQRFQLKTATRIIAVSKATKQDLINTLGIEEKKIKVVYEGYDKDNFQFSIFNSQMKQTIKKYDLRYQNYFLFVGTVQPRKNLERLIKAFKKAKGEQLVITGSKGWLSDEIYKLPRNLGIEDKVKFLGYVAEEDLPVLYSGALALIFPSLFEGFGLPILEAQAVGCPVLTSNISSMPEVAGDGAVYVNPYSIDDIVRGMIEIQRSKIKDQKVKAGFKNIKRFSWEKCAEETLEVLEKAV